MRTSNKDPPQRDDIICNLSSRYKAALGRCNQLLEYWLQSINYDFGDGLISNIAEAYRTKLSHRLRIFNLQDQDQDGLVKVIWEGSTIENIKYKITKCKSSKV